MFKRLWPVLILCGLASIAVISQAAPKMDTHELCKGLLERPTISQWLSMFNPNEKVTVKITGTPLASTKNFRQDAITLIKRFKIQVEFSADGEMILKGTQERVTRALNTSVAQFFKGDYQWVPDQVESAITATDIQVPSTPAVAVNFNRIGITDFIKPSASDLNSLDFDFQIIMNGTQARWAVVHPNFFSQYSGDELIDIIEEKSHANFETLTLLKLADLLEHPTESIEFEQLQDTQGRSILNSIYSEQTPVLVKDTQFIIIPFAKPKEIVKEKAGEVPPQQIIKASQSIFNRKIAIKSSPGANVGHLSEWLIREQIINNGDLSILNENGTYSILFKEDSQIVSEQSWSGFIDFTFNSVENSVEILKATKINLDEEKKHFSEMAIRHGYEPFVYTNTPPLVYAHRSFASILITPNIIVKFRLKHHLTNERINELLNRLSTVEPTIKGSKFLLELEYSLTSRGIPYIVVLLLKSSERIPRLISIHPAAIMRKKR